MQRCSIRNAETDARNRCMRFIKGLLVLSVLSINIASAFPAKNLRFVCLNDFNGNVTTISLSWRAAGDLWVGKLVEKAKRNIVHSIDVVNAVYVDSKDRMELKDQGNVFGLMTQMGSKQSQYRDGNHAINCQF
jgi:hypothetical protein